MKRTAPALYTGGVIGDDPLDDKRLYANTYDIVESFEQLEDLAKYTLRDKIDPSQRDSPVHPDFHSRYHSNIRQLDRLMVERRRILGYDDELVHAIIDAKVEPVRGDTVGDIPMSSLTRLRAAINAVYAWSNDTKERSDEFGWLFGVEEDAHFEHEYEPRGAAEGLARLRRYRHYHPAARRLIARTVNDVVDRLADDYVHNVYRGADGEVAYRNENPVMDEIRAYEHYYVREGRLSPAELARIEVGQAITAIEERENRPV